MPQRKFPLIPVLLAVVVVGFVLYATYFWFVVPWCEAGLQLADLDGKIAEKVKQIIQVRKERSALDRFEAMSLPTNLSDSRDEYDRYLSNLIAQHGFKLTGGLRYSGSSAKSGDQKSGVFGGNKKAEAIYTALSYKLDAQASVAHLTAMLREFDEAPLMHRIRTLDIKPLDSEEKKTSKKSFKSKGSFEVAVHMEFEAVIVEGATHRAQTLLGPDERLVEISALSLLKRGPGSLALIPWVIGPVGPVAQAKAAKAKGNRDYGRIERDNIFIGYQKKYVEPIKKTKPKVEDVEPPTPAPKADPYDMREFYKLILISKTPDGDEAWLYSPFKDHNIRLKTRPGFNSFAITDMEGEKTLLKGKVLKIDYGAVYFEANHRAYVIQRGENLKEALRNSIPDSELSKIGLKIAKAP